MRATSLHVKPYFQILLIVISSISLIAAVYYRTVDKFYTTDPLPMLYPFTPDKIRSFGGFPDTIKVGLSINQFEMFDILNNNFIFTGTIWFEFNPGVISLETLEKFSFEKGIILSKSHPETQLINDKLLVRYIIRVQFNAVLDYRNFPLDDHRISLTFSNHFVSPSEIIFESFYSHLIIQENMEPYGWKQVNHRVESGYLKTMLLTYDTQRDIRYPIVTFNIDFSRISVRYTLSILLPLLFLFYIILFSLSLDVGGISLASVCITALLAYRFVIENLSPRIGYFMISDYMFFTYLSICFFIFFLTIIQNIFNYIKLFNSKLFLCSLHLLIVGINLYFILFLTTQ